MSAAALLAASMGCGRKNEAKERIQAEREKWEASLPDSLKAIERETDSIRNEIVTLTGQMDELLPQFKYIDNPREVEGYYIANAWASSYPLRKTGLAARLTKGEKLELIAALAGGAYFDRIVVEAGGERAESSVVPHDQALNYRMNGLNTVCFSDSAANSCAKLISENSGTDVRIVYINGDKQTGTLSYPSEDSSVMADTWQLYRLSSTIHRDERMIPLLSKKAAIINAKIESVNLKSK